MILRKLLSLLLRRLILHICRQVTDWILYYCRRTGWLKHEIHSVRRVLIVLMRILLRLLMRRFMSPDATTPCGFNNTPGCAT